MKRSICAVLLSLILAAPCGAQIIGGNMLGGGFNPGKVGDSLWLSGDYGTQYATWTELSLNGSLDEWVGGLPYGWDLVAGDGAITEETSVVHTPGRSSIKIAGGATPANTPVATQTTPISVTAGATYYWSFWCYGDGTYAGRYSIYDVSHASLLVAVTSTGVTASSWTLVEGTFTAPAGCSQVRFYFRASATANKTCYFDGLSVGALGATSSACLDSAYNFVPNAGPVASSPYGATVESGAGNVGLEAAGTRYYFSRHNQYRLRQSGYVSRVRVPVGNLSAGWTDFYIVIWRKVGATWDKVGTSANLRSSLDTASAVNTVTLSKTIPVQEGDYVGYGIVQDATDPAFQLYGTDTGDANHYTYYVDSAPGNDFDWFAQSTTTVMVPIGVDVETAPVFATIGDSLIEGQPGHFDHTSKQWIQDFDGTIAWNVSDDLKGISFQNLGTGGNTTAQIAARITDVTALTPKFVVINGGTNDIVAGTVNLATFIANWTTSLDALTTAGITPIVLLIPPWTSGTTEQLQTRDAWNTALTALVATYTGAIAVDCSSAVGKFREGGPAGNLWDIQDAYVAVGGVHYNAAGYAAIAGVISAAIEAQFTNINENTVSTWLDRSAGSNNATNGSPLSQRPTWDSDRITLGAVVADGFDDELSVGPITAAGQFLATAVVQLDTTASNDTVCGSADGASYIKLTDNTTITVRIAGGAATAFTVGAIGTDAHIVSVTRSASNVVEVFLDGSESSTGDQTLTGTLTIERVFSHGTEFFDGGIGAAVIGTTASSDRRGILERYFAGRFGLSL